ncbi:hypothetical protein AB0P21_31470 [Kribbella sp. NPDC056861]|uniref:hypothetical protein n=1 Tax=Kribbella sp. NPDC056861 TaxID=3154857 RepID=UPI003447E540
MSENEDQSPYGRGFIAAAIVVAAVLACGGLLLLTGPKSASTGPTHDSANVDSAPTDRTNSPASTTANPNSAAEPQNPAAPSTPAATPTIAPLPDQSIPSTKPPTPDSWEVSRRVVVPRSTTNGPTTTDPDGYRHGFAHSPTGALYAAYNAIAALADQSRTIPTTRKLMLPGRDTNALIEHLKTEPTNTNSAPTQLAGYRVLDASRDRATIMLALPVESEYMSATLTLAWYAGDWRLVPPTNDNPVGAPYSQHRDLDGFVAWSGV